MKSSIAIAALLVAAVGVVAAAPVIAQSTTAGSSMPSGPETAPAGEVAPGADAVQSPGVVFGARAMMPGRAMGPGKLLMLACSPRGAETLDVALLRLSYRLDLTAEQKPLFDTFRDKALSTEKSFAETCKADVPAAGGAKPDFLSRLKSRISIDEARLNALNEVLPSFEALYASLTDAQKAALMPGGGWGPRGEMGGMHHGAGPDGGGRQWPADPSHT